MNFNNQLEVRKEKINKATEALKAGLNNLNYLDRLVYASVQGSTNYNLDVYNEYYESDVDWKVFILPTFKDLYTGNKISKTYTYEYGQFELKDIRLLPELLGKMNSSYLELLFSDYTIISDTYHSAIMNLRSLGDELISDRLPLLVKSLMGMCLEKQNALCHEYEGLKEKLAYFGGYDPKQLHHAIRLQYILQDIEKAVKNDEPISYDNILRYEGERRNYLLDIKVNGAQFGLPEALDIMKECVERGYVTAFIDAGAVVSTPTCGPCLGGYMGILAAGERCIATTNRNFVGRMGHVDSEVYLASPATAAASALTGYITCPKEV